MNNKKIYLTMFVLSIGFAACGNGTNTTAVGEQSDSSENHSVNYETGTLVDSRDGRVYKTVKIGGRWWMAENLNFKTEYSLCYNNTPSNCEKYGRLYYWDEAKNCPSGWYLPSKEDFVSLYELVDRRVNYIIATKNQNGEPLEYGEDHYEFYLSDPSEIRGSFNTYGFSALPAGYASTTGFEGLGSKAHFWSSTTTRSGKVEHIYYEAEGYTFAVAFIVDWESVGIVDAVRQYALSVRCVRSEQASW